MLWFVLPAVAAGAILLGIGQEPPEEPLRATIVMAPEITWRPDVPGEGRLFVLRVQASEHTPIIGVHGEAAGEELHFASVDERGFESLAAVPVGSDGRLSATVRTVFADGGESTYAVDVPVTAGEYAHEALSVAPRFGAPLSPADQARLDEDRRIARTAAERAHRTRRLWSPEGVRMPRESRVTSGFGDGRIFNGQLSSRHMGLDLQGFSGDTVVSVARGTVEVVAPFLLAGNVVYVNHGAGLLSAYFHLSRQLVAVGDTVLPGTPVGLVGATGRVTGPHLHWVVRYGNTSVDPRSLLDLDLAPDER